MAIKEVHEYERVPSETYSDLKKAITKMGKVINDDPNALTIEGKIKYGLGASTKVKAKVQQENEKSMIFIESRGGDFAGKAARENVKHLLETMKKVDDVDYDVNKPDKQQWMRVAYFTFGGLLIIFTTVVLSAGWMNLLWVVGLLFAVYIWGYAKLMK